ncbi:ribbon-helix-helix domain-containing protein [Pyrodictium delaneyi]|uniref:ribbon-helix-helix domain-containing protein n=1 Tax=Pyrodictium delaneyi TaxID=1273541 RepID=UPI001E60740C|nr:ribbon-helix-helix domain-containing protein [Pyrodictium delaneyi]
MPQTVIVTFKAPAELVERLDELVRTGVFRNRSEALRHALVILINRYRGEAFASEVLGGGNKDALQAT